jgi:hypothetical protein
MSERLSHYTADELARMECPVMLDEVERGIGRKLSVSEVLQLAVLSGVYRTGGKVSYYDLLNEAKDVGFPEYLRGMGYQVDVINKRRG